MGLNFDKLQEKQAKRRGTGWRPRDGDNRVRILPPSSIYFTHPEELDDFAIEYNLHFFKIEGEKTEVVRCLEDVGLPCPACRTWRTYRRNPDPAWQELAKQIKPSNQFLFNMLDLSNPQGGIQRWQANYTCHTGIMEIGVNPAWNAGGDVISPTEGINFVIKLIPRDRSPSGFNKYSVSPEPTRTSVMEILQPIAGWVESLDELASVPDEPGAPEEVESLIIAMGFPAPPSSTPAAPTAPAAPTPGTPPPPPPTTTAPPAAPAAPPAAPAAPPTTTAPPAAPAAPTPPPPPATEPAPPATPPPAAPAPAAPAEAPASGPHYDPGPDYEPKLPEGARPDGAPRCFGDYNPQLHRCAPCPVSTDCQIKHLGVETS